jgi:hypoxanthine phosphoribosyltransferase
VLELRQERGVVAAPAGHEEKLGLAAPGALVVEPQLGEVRVGHAPIVSRLPAVTETEMRFTLCRLFRHPTAQLPWLAMELELPVFKAFRGTEPPRFASPAELECAKVLDYYDVPWEYEPRTFVLEQDEKGRVTEAFTPDFFLPEQNLYVEITAMKQSLVTRKNRKLRKLRERYPDVRIKLFYRRDLERLAQHFHLDLAS